MSDFDRLRKVAAAATAGPWTAATSNDVFGPRGVDGGAAVVGYGMWQRNALHFATFDPQTVLALLDVAEAAGYADTKWTTRREDGWSCGGCGSTYDFTSLMADRCPACRIRSALARLREATGHE